MGAYIASSIADKPAFARRFWFAIWRTTKRCSAPSRVGIPRRGGAGAGDWLFRLLVPKVRLGKALQPLLGSMLIPFVLCWFSACSLTTLSGR